MTDAIDVYAGECTASFHAEGEGRSDPEKTAEGDPRRHRGRVVVLHKPDDTVLVHDAGGYRPVAWLTRADAVHREQGPDGSFALVAVKDGERLRVEGHGDAVRATHDASPAGVPVGDCPDCGAVLVHVRGTVACPGCGAEYGLPRDATVLEATCDCGLPRMAVERGARFECCVDRDCERLDAAVRERFDREWSCPDCGGDLRVLRERSLFLGCENYPDCDASFALPDGRVVGDCECGLPRVEGDEQPRCLDADCTSGAA